MAALATAGYALRSPALSEAREAAWWPRPVMTVEGTDGVAHAAHGPARAGLCGRPGTQSHLQRLSRGSEGDTPLTRKQWWPESDGPLATDSHRAIQLAREAACRARRTSKRLSSADQSRRHSAKARAHRPTARRRRPHRSVSALVQPEAAPSEGRSTPAMFVYPGRAQRRTNSPTKCESSTNGSNAMGAGA